MQQAHRLSAAVLARAPGLLLVCLVALPAVGRPQAEEGCSTAADLQDRIRDKIAALREGHELATGQRGVTGDRDIGDTAILVDDGRLSVGGFSDSSRTTQVFSQSHPDDFDLLAIYNDHGLKPEFGFAFHLTVRNEIAGLGREIRDVAIQLGYPTQKLGGYMNLNSLTRLPDGPYDPVVEFDRVATPVTLLAHEIGHQWLAALQIESFFIVGRSDVHWSFYLDSEASVLEGNRWRNNGDGTFTTVESFTRYGALDHYAMGLRPPEQVPPQTLITLHPGGPPRSQLPRVGVTVNGVPLVFSIDDVVAFTGERSPSGRSSPHSFRLAVALVVADGSSPSQFDLDKLDGFRLTMESHFRAETEGRGALFTRLDLPVSREILTRNESTESASYGFSIELGGEAEETRLLVGAPKDGAGCVDLLAATTGERLWRARGQKTGDSFGAAVRLLDDLDGDGAADVAVGAPGTGQVLLLSGSTGEVFRVLPSPVPDAGYGRALAVVGDLDGGGRDDLAVGAPRALARAGAIFIHSIETGALLLRIDGAVAEARLGFALARAPDLDADGKADLFAGAPFQGTSERPDAGTVVAFSTADGTPLFSVEGEAGDRLGAALASIPDLDSDGQPDLLAGAPEHTVRDRPRAGEVLVLSGADGSRLLTLEGGGSRDFFGAAVGACPDVDGDGAFDVVVGAPGSSPGGLTGAGTVHVFSSRDGALLEWIEGRRSGGALGASVAAAGGRGNARLALGSPGRRAPAAGAVRLVDLDPFHLSVSGNGALGSSLDIELDGGRPGETYAIFLSAVGAEGATPLLPPVGPGPDFALEVAFDHPERTLQGVLDAEGMARQRLQLPSAERFRGRELHLQAVVLETADPGPTRVRVASARRTFRIK